MSKPTKKTTQVKTRLRPNKSGLIKIDHHQFVRNQRVTYLSFSSTLLHSFFFFFVGFRAQQELCSSQCPALALLLWLTLFNFLSLDLKWCHCVIEHALPAVAQSSAVSRAAVRPKDVSTTLKAAYVSGAAASPKTA